MVEVEKFIPTLNNLPEGSIDWDELSIFIEDMLDPDIHCTKGWKIIQDPTVIKNLQENSIAVLNILHADLYGFFFRQKGERIDVWRRMEHFIRTKYNGLSEKSLSRVIATYHIDDR